MGNMGKCKKAFNRWYEGLNEGQTTLLRRVLELDAKDKEPCTVAAIAFHAGWMAARQQYKGRVNK